MNSPIEVLNLRRRLWTNGFRPIAVRTGEKNPVAKGWPDGARRGIPEAVEAWPSGEALSTGILCDGLRAVDVDVDDAFAAQSIRELAWKLLGLAPCRQRASSSRFLLLYRATADEPGKRVTEALGGRIEVLGRGQQFVAFGNHSSGDVYEWAGGHSPATFSLHSAPAIGEEALSAFLQAVAGTFATGSAHSAEIKRDAIPVAVEPTERDVNYARAALVQECDALRATRNGRNNALNTASYSIGRHVGNGSLHRKEAEDALFQASVSNGYTAKDGEEAARATIKSGLDNGSIEPRTLITQAALYIDVLPLVRSVTNDPPAKSQIVRIWPASIGEAAHIGIAGDFVRLVSPHTEGDPCALLVAFLTVIGSLMGRSAYLPVGPTRHHSNLFTVVVADTSKGRKGTVMAEAKRFAKLVDLTVETRLKSGLSSGEGLIEAVRDPRRDETSSKPGSISSGTILDKGVSDKRLLVLEGEMGQALQAASREGNTLSATLRLAWDGDELRTLARSNKNVCTEPHISIFGNITLDELQRLLSGTDRSNGFANRFLWVCAKRSNVLPWGGRVDEAALAALAAQASHRLDSATFYGQCGWTADGASLWAREYERLSAGTAGLAGAMSARAEAQTIRLALIYAVLDGFNNIDVQHLRAALEVWRYCQESVDYCFGSAMGDSTADGIATLLSLHPEGVTLTQISSHFGRNKRSDELQRALEKLKAAGKAKSESRKTNGRAAQYWFATA